MNDDNSRPTLLHMPLFKLWWCCI